MLVVYDHQPETSQRILYAQHGWADTNRAMVHLAHRLETANTRIIVPNLGWWRTWLRLEPLVQDLEEIVTQTRLQSSQLPIRIVAHSMGGLIWLEVLNRHPEWWAEVESLVLIGCPVGGADICRLIDPLALGLGIARDLGKNRRSMAERIAAHIPTLTIASDIDDGSDGLIMYGATQFHHAHTVVLPNIAHSDQRQAPAIDQAIQAFWQSSLLPLSAPSNLAQALIQRLHEVPGMTDGHRRDFSKAQVWLVLDRGLSLYRWKNPLGVDHVFVASADGKCLYSGFVGWLHAPQLNRTLDQIKQESATSSRAADSELLA
ncbi:MAG: alpha/beta hydrolase [Acaryochloridaceae cyanobacterium SU_2_1]|nr:alpha/beta hydrolase [Acaryochloridaceae cyanobacterium SU_2_1]